MKWGKKYGSQWGGSAAITSTQQILYDYLFTQAKIISTQQILYDYLKFVPDNVRITINPHAQDSIRLDWTGFVPPSLFSEFTDDFSSEFAFENAFTKDFFYGVYIDGEPYEVDIDQDQTWMNVTGLFNLECVVIEVIIQAFFGQRFTFDLTDVGDRIKVIFLESSDPNIHRYVFFGDNGTGIIDFTKEIGEIIVQERLDKVNTDFVPKGS